LTRHVVVDANVLISFFVERNEKQRGQGKALLLSAEEGEIIAVVPQFALFEIAYVLESFYKVPPPKIADAIRATLTYPGVSVTDDCSWLRVLDNWPEPLDSITDAAIVSVALANNYDSVATFDQKLIRRMNTLGVHSYF
jgi:predicted nucleic acid-binding protein